MQQEVLRTGNGGSGGSVASGEETGRFGMLGTRFTRQELGGLVPFMLVTL